VIALTYLATLLVSLGCLALVDHRWRLVLWADARRGASVLTAGTAFFLAWDVLAVHLGFYRRGEAAVMTGLQVAPGVPLEELFFVVLLCYCTLVLHRLLERFVPAAARREEARR
jgi:lycopene cyclase domain-containing protein